MSQENIVSVKLVIDLFWRQNLRLIVHLRFYVKNNAITIFEYHSASNISSVS